MRRELMIIDARDVERYGLVIYYSYGIFLFGKIYCLMKIYIYKKFNNIYK